LASLLWAGDLSTIERKIKTTPKFTAAQQFYALVVLGPEWNKRVWFVVDGDDVYIDRNGNGDLTDADERLRYKMPTGPNRTSPLMRRSRDWNLPSLNAGGRYTDIKIHFGLLNPNWRPRADAGNRRRMERFMKAAGKIPHANISSIYITIDGKRTQFCNAMFTTSAATAPIFHMDGPLTIGLLETIIPRMLERGEKPEDLKLSVGTPGFGTTQAGCFSYVMYDKFPEKARPVIEVRFPKPDGNGYLPPTRLDMKGKC